MANKIVCDKCRKEIKVKIETKNLKQDIEINFFRCSCCNTKYLMDVTDKEIREKQKEYRRLAQTKKNILITVKKDNLKGIEHKSKMLDFHMEALIENIKKAKKELKIKYSHEL